MPLGNTSLDALGTAHPDLQRLIKLVSQYVDAGALKYAGIADIAVLCGYRDQAAQEKAFKDKASKLQWPKSKHNRMPSDAVDVVVYPVDYKDKAYAGKMAALHAFICGVAARIGVELFNIDWDMPHIQRNVP